MTPGASGVSIESSTSTARSRRSLSVVVPACEKADTTPPIDVGVSEEALLL